MSVPAALQLGPDADDAKIPVFFGNASAMCVGQIVQHTTESHESLIAPP
jgi:hypothetical protein